MNAETSMVREAVLSGDYERAALRLVLGFMTAWRETAPEAREELIALIAEPGRRRGGRR
jgi:hypothetical protein